ncbi:glycosyltransferase family 2 protein [Phaeacidiphilus oryzae]|uniref:glycosyltransferase family 2 protein n=1 Tax=Phaeacidiphilus oryzae TaxID=348818 RepID=UPI00055CA1EE|nr:glycosyltransferase [Phaeacidiphilus oryzae]
MNPGAAATVAVITRNRRAELLRTLDRLTALPERPEVIVVDNASSDGTAEAVRRLHPRVRLLTPGRNLGAAGRNLAVWHAATPFVGFSDDDSWWAPGSLARACAAMNSCPTLGLVAARTLVGPDEREDPLSTELAGSPLTGDGAVPGTPVLGFLACASVVRREAFLRSGGFHPLLFFGAEETLLAYDLAADGWEVRYLPSVVAHHHPAAGARGGRSAVLLRNAALTAWLRRPVPTAAGRTARLAWSGVRGDAASVAALGGVLRRLPAALLARRRLPEAVERSARRLEEAEPA